MKTADLIDELASEFKPPKRPFLPGRETLVLLTWAALLTGLVSLFLHVRRDVAASISQAQFMLSALSLLSAWAILTFTVGLLQVPGRRARVPLGIGLGLLALLAVGLGAAALTGALPLARGFDPHGLKCAIAVLFLSALPIAATVTCLRRGAPVRPGLTGGVAATACGLLGAFALQFSCDNDHPVHLLAWHLLLPLLALAGAGWGLARRFLRW